MCATKILIQSNWTGNFMPHETLDFLTLDLLGKQHVFYSEEILY